MTAFRELSPKQIKSYNEADARINIWAGAVRSGKSFSALLKFINFIDNGPPGDMVIVGRTTDALKRNVIGPMIDLLGVDVKYKSGLREIKMWNRVIHVVGANDERAEGKIRGSTFAGALIDEITLLPESFFKMLLSRLSVPGAKLFGTTNPDSPFHWLKRDFLDNEKVNRKLFNFNLYDNPSLTPEYIKSITSEYSGLWYQRFIEGKWVLAEGSVFDMFDKDQHVITFPPGVAEYYLVGIDYGTANPTAFSLIGFSSRTFPNCWLEKEYYWDSRKEQKQKTDAEYARDLKTFISGYNVKQIYMDPSAASLQAELRHHDISAIEANNDVLEGIRYHATMLQQGGFKICGRCINTIKEYGSYRWDPQAQNRGEDKPIKEHDHMLDSIRYVLMSHFYHKSGKSLSIEDLQLLKNEAWGIDGDGAFW
jgi:PBSX family phage terminase large subunit